MQDFILIGRSDRPYRQTLLWGGAIMAALVCPVLTAPARAQCTSSGTTTTCSPGGNSYGNGIAVTGAGDAELVLQDGVVVERQGSPAGVSLTAAGNATLSSPGASRVSTTADNAGAVVVTAGGRANVTVGSVTTTGTGAAALTVQSGAGAVVRVGSVSTGGARSAGIVVDAGSNVILTANTVRASGGATGNTNTTSPGVNVTSRGGDITLTLGSVTTQSPSAGVIATSYGGGVNVTVNGTQTGSGITGGISTLGGIALDLSALSPTIAATATTPAVTYTRTGDPARAGIVSATIGSGTTVFSTASAAVRINALTGSNLTNNGLIGRSQLNNRAVDIRGGAASIVNNGTIQGSVWLTENGDTFVNNGTLVTNGQTLFDDTRSPSSATPNRDVDTLVNTGTIRVSPGVSTLQTSVFSGVEVFRNSGLIDLRSQAAGDVGYFGRTFVASAAGQPTVLGQYIASGNATIGLDLQFVGNTAVVDKVMFSALPTGLGLSPLSVTGTTKVVFNVLGTESPNLLIGLPVIYVPTGSTGTFELAQPMVMGGLQYGLVYDSNQTAWALYAAPNAAVLRQTRVPTNVQALWNRASDVVAARLREVRDRRWADMDAGPHLWMQAIGESATRNQRYSATINRLAISGLDFSQRQSIYGVQAGIDTAGPANGETGMIFGATIGYLQSNARFQATRDQVKADAVTVGGYASLLAGPVFVTASATYARHSVDDRLQEVGSNGAIRGDSYGVRLDGGMRFGGDTFFVEPHASITYAATSVGGVNLSIGRITFDDLIGNNGTAGIRFGGRTQFAGREIVYYAGGEAVHEFAGDDLSRLTYDGLEVTMPNQRLGTFGRGTFGLSLLSEARVSGFVEGQTIVARDYTGGGGRVGVRIAL